MKLEQDEQLILDNKFTKSKMRLVLTDKRLLVHEKREIISEISLNQIKEAQGVVNSLTSSSSLILNMKDGEQIQVTFEVLSGGHVIPKESKKITDNFLIAINNQIKI